MINPRMTSDLPIRLAPQIVSLLAITVVALIGVRVYAVERPNFVIIIGDDHGIAHSSPYGRSEYQTPNLQAMASEGIRLTNAYVASPACAPSRAALFTGLMPYRNGIVGNHERELKPGVESLIPILAAQGYDIAFRGKVAHGGKKKQPYLTDDVTLLKGPMKPELTLDSVSDYLENRPDKKRPLALFIGCTYPHRYWPEPEEARMRPEDVTVPARTFDTPETRSEMTRYAEAVERMDRLIGEVRDLTAKHLPADNTLTMYTSDHGQAWPFGKWSLYEAGIRTPVIAVWPKQIPAGVTNDAMVSWIDLMPTLIELAGGASPREIDGKSFASVLRNTTQTHRDRIFATHKGDKAMNVYPIRSVRVGRWKYIRNLRPELVYTSHMDLVPKSSRLFNRNWPSWVEAAKTNPEAAAFLRAYHSRPAEELYRIDSDPDETTNLASEPKHADKLAELRDIVTQRMKLVGDDESLSGKPRFLKDYDLPDPNLLSIDNGVSRVGIDRSKGASITWLSWKSHPTSIVNTHDPGRLIQQSYYAGHSVDRTADGQSRNWSPWSWNPIQGGGVSSWARVTQFKKTENATLFGETIPKLWDMPNEEAAAVMHQWTGFEPDMPRTVVVRNRIECDRESDDIWGDAIERSQEVPACYFTRDFDQFKSYLGDGKWRDEKTSIGPPWRKSTPPLNAMACFNAVGQGVAVYSPTANSIWNYGPHVDAPSVDPAGAPCTHVAPISRVRLGPQSTYEYRYWLVVGDADQIASDLDVLLKKYSDEKAVSGKREAIAK